MLTENQIVLIFISVDNAGQTMTTEENSIV